MSFTTEKCEVLGARCVLQLLDIGIVDAKTELVQFFLNAIYDFLFEDLAFLEYLFHSHRGDDDTCLAFDNAFDDVLDMMAAGRRDRTASVCWMAIWVAG